MLLDDSVVAVVGLITPGLSYAVPVCGIVVVPLDVVMFVSKVSSPLFMALLLNALGSAVYASSDDRVPSFWAWHRSSSYFRIKV